MLQRRSGARCAAPVPRRIGALVLTSDVCRSCRPSSLTLKRVTVKSSTNTGAAPWRGPNSALMVISAEALAPVSCDCGKCTRENYQDYVLCSKHR